MCLAMKVLLSNQIMKVFSLSERENSDSQGKTQKPHHYSDIQIKPYDWSKRWLKGDEYAHILRNRDAYCRKFGFQMFDYKSHPESIYKNPINGLIYFVKGTGVGSDFGFPRVSTRKKYRWKKMNFTTDLPKKRPFVTYVVASAMKANMMQNESDLPDYRMHAVIPYATTDIKEKDATEYILCHVRQVQNKRNAFQSQSTIQSCFSQGFTDFYRLFSFLHNLRLSQSPNPSQQK